MPESGLQEAGLPEAGLQEIRVDYRIAPLTPDLWPAFEDLFGRQGACYGCWCTHFRLPPAVRRQNDRESNRDHIKARIAAGPPPGLLLMDGARADGWMQIGPRADIPEWNNKGRVSAPLEEGEEREEDIWRYPASSCEARRAERDCLTRLLPAGSILPGRVARGCSKPAQSPGQRTSVPSAFSWARHGSLRRQGSRQSLSVRRGGR